MIGNVACPEQCFCDADIRKGGTENVILMDMGQHAIREWPEPQLLHQVLIPGLEDRARLIPDINTFEQITTGGHLTAISQPASPAFRADL